MDRPRVISPRGAILTLFALAAIFLLVDMGKVAAILLQASPWLVAAALAVYACTTLLMSFRIRLILSHMGEDVPFGKAFSANAAGLLASDVTPARAGYFVVPFILSKSCNVKVEKGMSAIVSPQIVEFFLKAAGAASAIAIIAISSPGLSNSINLLWIGVGVILAFCTAMYLALFVPEFISIARKFSFIPLVPRTSDFFASMQENSKAVSRIFPTIIAISAAAFLLKGLEWYLFGLAVRIEFSVAVAPFLIFLVLQPLVTVFQFTPFPTAAGIGLSEGSAVASMTLLGVPAESAISYALLVRAGTILVNSVGLPALLPFFLRK